MPIDDPELSKWVLIYLLPVLVLVGAGRAREYKRIARKRAPTGIEVSVGAGLARETRLIDSLAFLCERMI